MINYKLFKILVKGTGLVFGKNKFGTVWVEFKVSKNTAKTIYFINNNPVTMEQLTEYRPYGIFSLKSL